jgi:hypothetical protein
MSPRGGLNRRDDLFKLFFPKNLSCQCPPVRPVVVTSQTGCSLGFTGGTSQIGAPHRSDGVAQSICKNNFKLLLTSSMTKLGEWPL